MNGYKVLCIVVTSALLISLGTHLAGASDEVEPGVVAATPAVGPGRTGLDEAPSPDSPAGQWESRASAQPHITVQLTAQMEACRELGWGSAPEPLSAEAVSDTSEPSMTLDSAEAIVNDVAREHLRQHWNGKREELIESLQGVGSDDWVTQEVDKKVAARAERFELDEAERERLSDGYDALWRAHAEELAAGIADEDWEGVMAQAGEIWADEDALLGAHLQADEHEFFLAEEQRGRVTILAIFATLAELPWDDEMLSF